jgi:hypothetical protein
LRIPIIVKFARLLLVSRLRSTKRSFVPKSILNKPILVMAVGTGLFIPALLAGIATVSFLRSEHILLQDSQGLIATILAGTPLFLTGFYFTMGLLWELNASAEVESTDAVNWLPISPAEYVAASSLSTGYTYSPVMMIALGFALPVAIFASRLLVFLLLVPAALIASLTGAVAVEILRSGLARASAAFTRVGGRIMIVMRILGIMLILVLTQLLFSGFLLARIIGSLVSGSSAASFVPVFWPTLSITSAIGSDLLGSTLFFVLSVGFLLTLSWVALYLKARYWVIMPGSIHLSSAGAISRPSRLALLGLNQLSMAMLRREIRSATRRKEVIRLVVIPIIIPVMIGFPLIFSPTPPPSSSGPSQLASAVLAVPFLFGVGLGAVVLAMTSIGQEGRTIWNLCALPVTAAILVRTKMVFTALIATIGLILGLSVTSLFFGLSAFDLLLFFGLGIVTIIAEAGIGLAVGSKFPDFSEGPRPRFVSIKGSIIGSALGLLGMFVLSLPVLVGLVLRLVFQLPVSLPAAFSMSGLVGVLLAWAGYRYSKGQVEKILQEVPG